MNYKILLVLFILISSSRLYAVSSLGEAVVIVPVSDVINNPYEGLLAGLDEFYATLPLSPVVMQDNWPRLHQVLFNETVLVIKEYNHQSLIEIQSCFLLDDTSKTIKLRGWLKSKDLYKKSSKNYAAIASAIPASLTLKSTIVTADQSIVVLVEPWSDEVTQQVYSAGTRFVRNSAADMQDFYGVLLYDHAAKKIVSSAIVHHALLLEDKRTSVQQREIFMSVLKQWCLYQMPIGYVFGGMSFTKLTDSNNVVESLVYNTNPIQCWQIEHDAARQKTGFDCSGMLLRAAHIAGMPYFFKNSISVKRGLKKLTEHDQLQVGDLIWTPGHIMVVACLAPALIIEAVGYAKGYGKVQMVPLEKRFKDITTWHDLLGYYFTHKMPVELNNNGTVYSQKTHVLFLRLESLWNT